VGNGIVEFSSPDEGDVTGKLTGLDRSGLGGLKITA